MKTIRVNEIFVPLNYTDLHIKKAIAKRLRLEDDIIFELAKKSIDARKKDDVKYVLCVDVTVEDNYVLRDKKSREVQIAPFIVPKITKAATRPVIVGFGPGGIFAALILARSGLNPIVLERGSAVEKRQEQTTNFFKNRILNTESNVQFGEGGAGTFSDGKLNSGINDVRTKQVLKEFVNAGAPEEILYEAKPHIGTDNLPKVVKNIREQIISLGGEVHFDTKMTELISENGKIKAVKAINDQQQELLFETEHVILAIGHSARDTYRMLRDKFVFLEQKDFSVGVRIEHEADMINKAQYGKFHNQLPTADYKLFTHLPNGRGVYTFCMCPGGTVVGASSVENAVVTNGMSNFARDAINSNAAVLVNVSKADFAEQDILGGLHFQEEIEKHAFKLAGSNYSAPCQRYGDFLEGKITSEFGTIKPSYEPGVSFCDINELFPEFISTSIKLGIKDFSRRLKGFDNPDAIITAPETRSSSPLRITRGQNMQSINVAGLYPCGEGAGYAGGITSAAVDGIKCAEAIIA